MVSECPHELLDAHGEIRTSAPPQMRCAQCEKWVTASDHCWCCGRKGTASLQPINPAPQSDTLTLPAKTYSTIRRRMTCRACGKSFGATHIALRWPT